MASAAWALAIALQRRRGRELAVSRLVVLGVSNESHRISGAGIFTYILVEFFVHVGTYTIHGSLGI